MENDFRSVLTLVNNIEDMIVEINDYDINENDRECIDSICFKIENHEENIKEALESYMKLLKKIELKMEGV